MNQLTFLGTGDAMGVPRVYCNCSVCEEARLTGANRRLRSSVLVEGDDESFLIDCGPDWRTQMENMGIRHTDTILVTHAHFDHIAGLPEWADACRWLGKRGRLYAPQEVIDVILRQFPWLQGNLDLLPADGGIRLGGWDIQGWRVNHGKNGYSYAYRLTKSGFTWAYCSDAIGLNEAEKKPLNGLDLLVLGTSFYHEEAEYSTRSVYDMLEAQELLVELKPKRTLFTHMSHDVDVNQAYSLADGIALARTGTQVRLAYKDN
ncbi:MBL fold metallo-hydrolase [Paenibacillus sp. P96]|uniref:MBL fold metallo-hydrolase n=1 Tax=Paenibacillus zeirhizosphaerae TaxID=2987519 RepID=A0ABT9FKP4_9BACL|nr:MBL fold metallo-hydrolase [Paenibacillus sp. P96]MDP4095299.1 MBL fold metallo-hydrolase [Paenibacillus sp. P96]